MLARIFFALAASAVLPPAFASVPLTLTDAARDRDVPVELYFPADRSCTSAGPCPVAVLSTDYGVSPATPSAATAPPSLLLKM